MANGRVITGFSKPKVATYSATGTTITYSNYMALARGVSVSLDIETSDDNGFWADNVLAESSNTLFSSGSLTLTVDGLKEEARTLIMGLPTPTAVTVGETTVDVYEEGNTQSIPYVGVGFIVRFMEGGVTSYVPYVIPKVIFSPEGLEANTEEDGGIEFQTTELEATIHRDDSAKQVWRKYGEPQTTEALAEAVIAELLGGA